MPRRIPLYYTFGNHMHWVDMEWLWGYDVLPGSTEDMLEYCQKAGVKGNLNFDGIGYEKMASESPEHLALLRAAIKEGTIEVVGGSYGQPYGLFHGGESNIRQRIYGVRTAIRVLGTRPRTFWEEEFDFYPQLPQILAGCGFTGASLYFQWTWHTPEVPMEEAPVVAWEGMDGTRIPTATRNRMNLHQWPEDFRILLDDLAANPPEDANGIPPLVLQWLELMPTQDWMCRSELMLPMLAELKSDPRFEVLAATLGEYLAKWEGQDLPIRRYRMDDVWHGMTLGKNGDAHPKKSAELEHKLLEAETAAAILGLFGRPYEPWDVYPTWELEECWRQLLAAQHHDNHECEGLCGHVAKAQFAFVETLLAQSDAVERLAQRVGAGQIAFNRHGWPVEAATFSVGPMGYRTGEPLPEEGEWQVSGETAVFESPELSVEVDVRTGSVKRLNGIVQDLGPRISVGKSEVGPVQLATVVVDGNTLGMMLEPAGMVYLWFRAVPRLGELRVTISVEPDPIPLEPGYQGAVCVHWGGFTPGAVVRADGPYSVATVGSGSKGQRKYPEGDWMTSPQWFESVEGAFTSQSFVDIAGQLLISHSGSQQWFRTESGVRNVILAVDPWDEANRVDRAVTTYSLFPHSGLAASECIVRSASERGQSQDVLREEWPLDASYGVDSKSEAPLPRDFSAVTVHSSNVLATAFYREQSSHVARGLDRYAGEGISHPYLLRLVEADGLDTEVEITLPGPVAKAFKTNLMGEILEELTPSVGDPRVLTSEPERLEPFGIEAVRVKLPMRPYEIATLYLDIVPGRKQFRDLDAKREIWATVHRVEG